MRLSARDLSPELIHRAAPTSAIATIATVGPYQIAMVDSTGTYNLETASALNSAGNSFTDTWLSSC